MKYKRQIIFFMLFMIVLCCFLGIMADKYTTEGICISEVRNDYGSILYDENESCHGFIELYNNSDKSIDLSGWYLSDKKSDLFKYEIKDCVIQPHEYIAFYSNTLEDVKEILADGYFLGFSLSKGETVFLTDDKENVIDKITIPDLPKGKSYSVNNSGKWYKSEPTPAIVNGARISDITLESPEFSLASGFYDNGTQVEIKAERGCSIYYTLDGSQPTLESEIYDGPIILKDNSENENIWSAIDSITFVEEKVPHTSLSIDQVIPDSPVPKINVIKAFSVDEKGNISETATASYVVGYESKYGFDNRSYGFGNVMTISITTHEDNLFGSMYGIYTTGNVWDKYQKKFDLFPYSAYTNFYLSGKGWRRSAKAELFDEDGKLIESQDIAIAIHGALSTGYNQKSFNLYAQEDESGNQVIFDSIFSGKQKSLMLRAGGHRDLYSTKIRDVLNQKMMEDTAVLATDFMPCQVFLNGEYWGLYNLQERIDESLVEAHYGVNSKNAIILKNYNVVSGEPQDSLLYKNLVDYAAQTDLSIDENYQEFCQMVDIDSYIDYHVFQIYVGNCDSIANNRGVWRSRNIVDDEYADGKWRYILYDTDDSANMVQGYTEPDVDSFASGHWSVAPLQDEIFTALIKNEEFRLKFADRFIEMANHNFSLENVNRILDEFLKSYPPAVTVSHRRFMNPDYEESEYYEQIQSIRDFYEQRYDYIYKYMVEHLELEAYGY